MKKLLLLSLVMLNRNSLQGSEEDFFDDGETLSTLFAVNSTKEEKNDKEEFYDAVEEQFDPYDVKDEEDDNYQDIPETKPVIENIQVTENENSSEPIPVIVNHTEQPVEPVATPAIAEAADDQAGTSRATEYQHLGYGSDNTISPEQQRKEQSIRTEINDAMTDELKVQALMVPLGDSNHISSRAAFNILSEISSSTNFSLDFLNILKSRAEEDKLSEKIQNLIAIAINNRTLQSENYSGNHPTNTFPIVENNTGSSSSSDSSTPWYTNTLLATGLAGLGGWYVAHNASTEQLLNATLLLTALTGITYYGKQKNPESEPWKNLFKAVSKFAASTATLTTGNYLTSRFGVPSIATGIANAGLMWGMQKLFGSSNDGQKEQK